MKFVRLARPAHERDCRIHARNPDIARGIFKRARHVETMEPRAVVIQCLQLCPRQIVAVACGETEQPSAAGQPPLAVVGLKAELPRTPAVGCEVLRIRDRHQLERVVCEDAQASFVPTGQDA
jgi:hypothetical protein